jgi:HSP20 family molecular chaperone IbpA
MLRGRQQRTPREPASGLDAPPQPSSLRELPAVARLLRLAEPVAGAADDAGISVVTDLLELEDVYVISAELPGIRAEDLRIEYRDGLISIRGEKRADRMEERERPRIAERSYGPFVRAFRIPEDADADRIEASLQDGVLRIEIEKRGSAGEAIEVMSWPQAHVH